MLKEVLKRNSQPQIFKTISWDHYFLNTSKHHVALCCLKQNKVKQKDKTMCQVADWEEEKKGEWTRSLYLKIHRHNQKG